MTDEIDTSAPERIWGRVCPDWHDGETGENFVGGQFDAGHFKDGTAYVRADLYDAERQRAEKAEAEKLHLRDVVCESMLQLRWLNEKEQRGTTNTVLARLEHALRQYEGGE